MNPQAFFDMAISQVPGIAALLVVFYYSMKYLKGRDALSQNLADSCHRSQEQLFQRMETLAEQQGEVMKECSRAMRNCKSVKEVNSIS